MVEHKHDVPVLVRLRKYTKITARIAVLSITTAAIASAQSFAAPVLFLQDTFMDASTTPGVWGYGGKNYSTCLTAGNNSANSIPACGDITEVPGSGALRLTKAANSTAGHVIYNQAFTTAGGVDITFDSYQYGGTPASGYTGDGIAFFLLDGSKSPTSPGVDGYGLGYINIDGGYVGVGLDHYGNFTTANVQFPGQYPDNIVLRGSQANNYATISHTPAQQSLAGTTRANSQRRVHVTIDKNNVMNVSVSYDGGLTFIPTITNVNLATVNGQGSMPATLKLGFTASTGAATDVHEIRNLAVKSIITPVVATGDAFTAGTGTTLGNVFANDTVGTTAPVATNTTATLVNDAGTGVTLSPDGTLTATKTLQPGTYALQYQICETASPNNCSTATATVTVPATITVTPVVTQPTAPVVKAPNTGVGQIPLKIVYLFGATLLLATGGVIARKKLLKK